MSQCDLKVQSTLVVSPVGHSVAISRQGGAPLDRLALGYAGRCDLPCWGEAVAHVEYAYYEVIRRGGLAVTQ